MRAIFKKDFTTPFHTLIGWIFIAVLWFFVSLFVSSYNLIGLDSSIVNSFGAAEISLMILLPILTMRSFADERRQRTDQLIYTAPVSIGKIVFGKFLANAAIFSIPVAGFCLYPLLLGRFGSVPYALNYSAILGVWLYGLACIAICIFASSLTESPVIAAVLGFAFLLISYLVPVITGVISRSATFLTKILDALDIVTRWEEFMNGVLSLSSVVYMITVIALFLFLTTQVIQKRRYSVSKTTFSVGGYSVGMIIAAFVIAVLVNLGIAQLPENFASVDVSQNRLYTLSDDTKEAITELDKDVTIYVLVAEKSRDDTLGRVLDRYDSLSDHLNVVYIDPITQPDFADNYTADTSSLYTNSMIVVSGDRSKIVNYSDIYEIETNVLTSESTVTGYDAEGQITSAIAYVTSDANPTVYVLTGHGEKDLDDSFTAALDKMHVNLVNLDLIQNESVPADAQAVIIYCPLNDLSSDDAEKLTRYFDNGGNLIAVTCFESQGAMTNFNKVLAYYGVSPISGIVLDSDTDNYYSAESYLLPNVLYDADITKSILKGNGYVFVPFSQALTETPADNIVFTDLLKTSGKAYIRTNISSTSDDFAPTDSDELGTYVVGVRSDIMDGEEIKSTGIIYSSLFVFSSSADDVVSGSNTKLFNGSISAVTDNEIIVSIPVKDLVSDKLIITRSLAIRMSVIFVGIIPAVLIAIGFVIWLKRRKH